MSEPDRKEGHLFRLHTEEAWAAELDKFTHVYCGGARCGTETRGYANPDNKSINELVVDASKGFIPLWQQGVTLGWRFEQRSLAAFVSSEEVKRYVRELLAEAILAWGPAAPIKFTEVTDPWDFEIVLRTQDDCNPRGCVLGSAFFPEPGQNELVLFPRLFAQERKEQVETLVHELGHIFGLRHFFADVSENEFPSEIYGTHERFSIMNYGPDSALTATDVTDLMHLYQEAWSGRLTAINGTPIRLVTPFSNLRTEPVAMAMRR